MIGTILIFIMGAIVLTAFGIIAFIEIKDILSENF